MRSHGVRLERYVYECAGSDILPESTEQLVNEKVLLADNNQNMLAGVKTLLEKKFKMVFMVADEASLFEAAEKINPDLIIADLSLRVSGEINIVRSLKHTFPGLKLIILSVHDEPTAVSACMDAGADGFVLKRSAVDDLIPAIDGVLGNSRFISQSCVAKTDRIAKKM